MPKSIRHACRFLAGNDKIAEYLDAIKRNAQLLSDVRRLLPAPLRAHCLHATLDGGVLTLITDSPVWSSRLRFFGPELERSLASRRDPVTSCRIRIQPKAAAPPRSADERRYRLSRKTAKHLNEAAAGIEDAALAAALRRLAKTGAEGD